MTEHLLVGLASIIVLGILAQWLAWRLHLPAILLLLIFGVVAGPVTGVLNPDLVFGELLFPLVSISVAIILFEGGLNLKLSELKSARSVIGGLVTTGIVITWVLAATGAYFIAGLELRLAVLLGAVLVVSGPTVIIPLLRQIRPLGNIGSIVKWEGIVNDPIGALLAVLVFEVILLGGAEGGASVVVTGVLKALVLGGGIGVAGAGVIVLLLKRYYIPDFLQNPVSLMLVVVCYVTSEAIQPESGLLSVTVMGMALANQQFVSIRHILEFKENLRVLLIASLFIILAARLPIEAPVFSDPRGWLFVAALIFVVRPLAVIGATFKSSLTWRERLFLMWIAPRGIVAAAVVSVFAIRLSEVGIEGGETLVPLTFQVIAATVAVYGLTSPLVARLLKVALPNPQGVLIAGAHAWAREIGLALEASQFPVVLIDSNWANVDEARKAGLDAHYANVLSEDIVVDVPMDGIGRFLALTPNDEVNALAVLHFVDVFGRAEVYQLAPTGGASSGNGLPLHLRGRYLFAKEATFGYVSRLLEGGARVKAVPMTEEFDLEAFTSMYGSTALPLFVVSGSGKLGICTAARLAEPDSGDVLISIVDPVEETSNV
ncbi:MAG: sodium:proton antiporter [bacterium]|nr:sodium:proton antiporter [bacterium]